MEQTVYQQYLSLLRQELIPAMGCTEPIALAYCAAATWDAAGGGGAAGPLQLRPEPAFAHTEGNGFARHPFAALSPAACTRAQ